MLAANDRKPNMNADGIDFLEQSVSPCPNAFERRCSRIASSYGLEAALAREDLILLYRAALLAALCNLSLNGSCACGGEIKLEGEPARRELEQTFMAARDAFLTCEGWRALPDFQKGVTQRIFLNVFVTEDNLVA
jgi:hypothetical protein